MEKHRINLSLRELRAANLARCEEVFHPLHDWSPTDWATAVGGEVGEMLNVIKKIRRGDFTVDEAKEWVLEEAADVVIYLDLLAARFDMDLGAAIIRKFNKVSRKNGSNWRIGVRATAVYCPDCKRDRERVGNEGYVRCGCGEFNGSEDW